MAKFYSVDLAASYVHGALPEKLQEKYSITLIGYILDGANEYIEDEAEDPEDIDYDAMLKYIVEELGATDGFKAELTTGDLESILEADAEYVEQLDDEED